MQESASHVSALLPSSHTSLSGREVIDKEITVQGNFAMLVLKIYSLFKEDSKLQKRSWTDRQRARASKEGWGYLCSSRADCCASRCFIHRCIKYWLSASTIAVSLKDPFFPSKMMWGSS